MALDAAHGQRRRQRAATADAQQVAQSRHRRGFTGDAPVDAFATQAKGIGDLAHTVDGIALLVRGQQQCHAARMIRMRGDEPFQRNDERRDAAFHVRRATAVQQPVPDLRLERIAVPGLARPGRHDIGMAQQHQRRAAIAMGSPQVVDVAEAQALASEPCPLQALRDQLLAAGIVRRHRVARDQFAGQFEHIACQDRARRVTHAPTPKRFLKPLSLKPCADLAIIGDHDRPADQLRVFLQQQLPLGVRSRVPCDSAGACARSSTTC